MRTTQLSTLALMGVVLLALTACGGATDDSSVPEDELLADARGQYEGYLQNLDTMSSQGMTDPSVLIDFASVDQAEQAADGVAELVDQGILTFGSRVVTNATIVSGDDLHVSLDACVDHSGFTYVTSDGEPADRQPETGFVAVNVQLTRGSVEQGFVVDAPVGEAESDDVCAD